MTSPNAPPAFTAYPLLFELEAVEPIYLHAHNGSALRGMFYRAVVELAGGDARAPDLHFVSDPAIRRLLAALEEDNPRGQDVPRPYVIRPFQLPKDRKHRLDPGERFTFGINVFGDIIEVFPVLVLALKQAETYGIGRFLAHGEHARRARGRFRLQRVFVHNPLTRLTQECLVPGEREVRVPTIGVTHEDVMHRATVDAQACPTRLRVVFHTPMTLRANGQVILRPNFSVLIHRLIERLTQLSTHYGPEPLPCLPLDREARNALLRLADAITPATDDTRWVVERGHSARTQASPNLSGFVGSAEFVGDFAPFFPLLRWGELCHAGNHTIKGNGLFSIQPGGGQHRRTASPDAA